MALRTAEDVFVDYCGRRRGILRALTTEVDTFYDQCSPERENLCLYGHSNGTWEVGPPCEEVPPEIPEPTLGINFARDGMKRGDWLSLIAVYSDSWLMSTAFFNGARLDADGRRQLFNDINSLPTCFEIVSGRAASKPSGTMPVQVSRRPVEPPGLRHSTMQGYDQVGVPAEYGARNAGAGFGMGGGSEPCPNCGRKYRMGEFWIACDYCDRWFDGKCVGMTPQRAERSDQWQCPFCANAR